MTPFNALPSLRKNALLRKSPAWITAAALLALVAGFAFFGAGPAHAQGGDNEHVDVALDLEWPVEAGAARKLSITVMNHGARTAYDVEVVVDIVYPENSSRFTTNLNMPVGSASLENNKHRLRWTIPELGGLERETAYPIQIIASDNSLGFNNVMVSHEFFGEVTTSSFESDLHKGNNTDRIWFAVISVSTRTARAGKGFYRIDGVSVDEPNPSPGDIVNVTFDIEPGIQIDGEVAIELTDGLAVDEDATATPPREISIVPVPSTATAPTYSDGLITIGTRPADDDLFTFSVTLPIRVASDAIVNEQCLTATITGNPPPGAGPLDDDISDNVGKACLGDQPVEPFVSGQVDTFTIYPCVGITTSPCDSTNDVRVRAVDKTTTTEPILNAGDTTINIVDAAGRTYDGQMHNSTLQSVNSADKVSWQTATDSHTDFVGARRGVKIGFTRGPFNDHLTDWTKMKVNVTVEGADGDPPGALHLRNASNGRFLFSLNSGNSWTRSVGPFNLTSAQTATNNWFAEFETLGAYTMEFSVEVTHATETGDCDTDGDNVNDAFCASETYTFHVGPMADLTVEDGGGSPHVGADQHALTVVAVNNGPSDAGSAKVTGLPTGAEVIHIDQGTYDSATGEWDIGDLKVRGYYPSRGEPDPTLVLGASAGDTANVSIVNSKNYEVCIGPSSDPQNLAHTTQSDCEAVTDASWNSTPVYDYDDSNNTATITAQAGTGGVGEGIPALQIPAVHTPAVGVSWSKVDFLHGVPVKDYQVQWSNDGVSGWTQLESDLPFNELFDITVHSGQTRYYRVRAVNAAGVPGPWSEPMSAMAGVVGISVSPTELTIAEGETAEYTVRLLARPTSSVTVRVNAAGVVSPSPNRLTFTPSNFSTPQTVELTGIQDGDAEDDNAAVTHSVSSSDADYRVLSVEPVAVTVIDDDSAVSIAADQQSVNEGDTVIFTLNRTGNTTNAITVSVRVAQRGDYLAPGESGNRTVDIGAGSTGATVTVATENDTVQENPGSVIATVQSGTDYFLGSPRFATVSVADDDGPPGQPVSLTGTEGDEEVMLTWIAAPSPSSAIESYSYRVRGTSGGGWNPDWTVIAGSGPGTVSHTVYDLDNGTEYTIQVRARNASGDGAAAEVTANPRTTPESPDVTVASRHESLLVTWHVPDDGGRDITEYQVQWKSGGESFDSSRQATATTGEHTIPSLINGTKYQVRVRARNEAGWGNWSSGQPGTPTPRPATSLSITTNAEDGVGEPFRVTFTFTDEDHDGAQYGVTGFDLDDIQASYTAGAYYEFDLSDFKEEKAGFVYSALVDQLLDGTLLIDVPAGVAMSTHDGQESTSATFRIRVDVPQGDVPSGTQIWSAEMTVGDYSGNARGYINPDLSQWDPNGTVGSLSDGDAATDDDYAFTYAGKNYAVGEISFVPDWSMILFVLCPGLEGADSTFDLYLDDMVEGQQDHTLNFDPDEVGSSNFSGAINGAKQSCVEYRWSPRRVDWEKDGTVNLRLVK